MSVGNGLALHLAGGRACQLTRRKLEYVPWPEAGALCQKRRNGRAQFYTLLPCCMSPNAKASHGAAQVREVVQEASLKPFPDPFIEGFKYDEEGRIVYPGMQVQVRTAYCFIAQRQSLANAPHLSVVLLRTSFVSCLLCSPSWLFCSGGTSMPGSRCMELAVHAPARGSPWALGLGFKGLKE